MSELNSVDRFPGLVYTFYSYKGGVGRSMALANVGVLMAAEGYRVLLVDWDLEAPGLEMFFRNAAKVVADSSTTPGVVDLLDAQARGKSLVWRNCLLKAEFFGYSLDIISSGRRDEDYTRRVQQLNWDTLFSEHRIGNYINDLREEWRHDYDFILVDSRTGITDISDICTVILPDVLVLLFTTNHQNVEGIKNIMARAVKIRSALPDNRSKLLAIPVPGRDERYHEYDKSVEWQNIFATEFSDLYREWLPKEVAPMDALNHIFLPYVSGWSFGERIPVIESEREGADPTSLGAAYARLAALLSHRLDWSAIEAKASTADVVGTRVELSKAREAAREAERARDEEGRRAGVAEKAEQRLKMLSQTLLSLFVIGFMMIWLWQRGYTTVDQVKLKIQSTFVSIHKLPEMVMIPGGIFQMGDVERSGDSLHNPVRQVKVKPFAMGKYEVTFEEYDRFAIVTGRRLPDDQGWGRDRRPVINVSWQDATAYAKWLSQQTGQLYRLPTEAEWEYAARSGARQENWAGTLDESQLENYAVFQKNSNGKVATVGGKKPNDFGLYDMSGNVWEWVADCWHNGYYGAPKDGSVWLEAEDGDCSQRVQRGGSWTTSPVTLRSSNRTMYPAEYRSINLGFRLARDIVQ